LARLGDGVREPLSSSLDSLEYSFDGSLDVFCVGFGDALRMLGLGLG